MGKVLYITELIEWSSRNSTKLFCFETFYVYGNIFIKSERSNQHVKIDQAYFVTMFMLSAMDL